MSDESAAQRWERLSKDRVDRPLPKRFYKAVSVGNDLTILLDGRAVKTPLKQKLVLPTRVLAEAIGEEWVAVDKVINPALMPLTKLANTAIDTVTASRDHVVGEIVAYAGNDLVCYRAEKPSDLVALQADAWDPVLLWAKATLGAEFLKTTGVIHIDQPQAALSEMLSRLLILDNFRLTAIHSAMTLTGSALLALMLHAHAISAAQAWAAAHVDEDFQIAQWGPDAQAAQRREWRKADFYAAVRLMELLNPLSH